MPDDNPLRQFFNARVTGRGIWKWDHYFDIYHRHFEKFCGLDVHVLEIGVYSGGSLDMWRDYFGPQAHIYGIDIAPDCKVYDDNGTKIFIGDQADKIFWRRFREAVPVLDIVIDDGGHTPQQQSVSLEALLNHLRPGGVYLCEDIHGPANKFASFVHERAHWLNATENLKSNAEDNENCLSCEANGFQSSIGSICLYPYVAVFEKNEMPVNRFVAPKHGTEWLDGVGP
jgi:hypothetical protein